MIHYSIADLENLTDIKAHTIRIWEKRYNLIKPFRTSTNIRYYDNDQLKKLINVASLIRSGLKISKVSELTDEELNAEIKLRLSGGSRTEDENFETYTGQMINAGLEFDEHSFEKTFVNAMMRYGLQTTYEKILIPLMNRVGMFWSTNSMNPAQEHFVTNLIRKKLYSAIDSLPVPAANQKPVLLFLPDHEDHEIALLMAYYILKNNGKKVVYLGARVPFENLKSTVEQCHPGQMLFFIIQIHPFEVLQEYIDQVSNEFTDIEIFLSGYPYILNNLQIPKNIQRIYDPQDFNKILGLKS